MASRILLDKARQRFAEETGCRPNPWGGRLSIALVYPNTYHQAMSNLGFLTVYQQLNSRADTLAERFFLPDSQDLKEHRRTDTPLLSLESARPLAEFDLIAFSISFENDYLNLPIIFDLARIPLYRRQRNEWHPLILCGGVCAFLNPEPLAEVMDFFAVGEAEVILAPLLSVLSQADGRDQLLAQLPQVPGIYVPAAYSVEIRADGTLLAGEPLADAPSQVQRQWLQELDDFPTNSSVLTRETEFGELSLVEVSRGCSRGCRFCAAGYLYLPPRERGLETLVDQAAAGLCQRPRIGLVGAAVSDYSQLEELNNEIMAREGEISVASLRIDSMTVDEVAALKKSGHRTIALAPEAGSQRMRDAINKNLTTEQILTAVDLLGAGGILNLKLYFLVGLPGEEDDDIAELEQLIDAIRDRWLEHGRNLGRLGNLILSVNPFIPKPFTPFQWSPMAPMPELKRIQKRLTRFITPRPNTEIHFESLRSAQLQAFLSRGDRRIGELLPQLSAGKGLDQACQEAGIALETLVYIERPFADRLPWEILDIGVNRSYLWSEYQKSMTGKLTPACFSGCQRCGVCG